MKFFAKNMSVTIDEKGGFLSSLVIGEKERCVGETPLFLARLRDRNGDCFYIDSTKATLCAVSQNQISYTDFGDPFSMLSVALTIRGLDAIEWYLSIDNVPKDYVIEWVEYPRVRLPRLIDNDKNGGKILFPYNEGAIITDETKREREYFRHYEPEYPSIGVYAMFPNMICSQFMAYLFEDVGFYVGAHDLKRSPKGIDYYPDQNGIFLQMRLFAGADFGESYAPQYPIVWQTSCGDWKSAADIYRAWFEENLPPKVTPTLQNKALPEWYEDAPVVVTYPVRGIHDMDKMDPNALFPYVNAMPILNKIKEATNSRLMALLMHWEGTAPWAPPYVWPPYGGEEALAAFRDALHENGDLLGVYCSGFGYTLQSNLIADYHTEEEIERRDLLRAMCHSPQNEPEISKICTGQRRGYDICPASELGRELLYEAYTPLFHGGIDYAQILDQNHGGGQYFCYAKEHGHPPVPGEWMTTNMQELLSEWNTSAPHMLFGCESAAAEPFIGNLAMSDNRFELNYLYGAPVPLYAYLYHEYVRNFMGNQVCCPFDSAQDTLHYRLGYSFSIGDLMTLVLCPNGKLMTHWGTRDFEHCPDMETTLAFIKNLMSFYRGDARKYLYAGKMKNCSDIECEEIAIPLERGKGFAKLPRLLSSCWEAEDGKTAYIVVNPDTAPAHFYIDKIEYEVEPLNARLVIR